MRLAGQPQGEFTEPSIRTHAIPGCHIGKPANTQLRALLHSFVAAPKCRCKPGRATDRILKLLKNKIGVFARKIGGLSLRPPLATEFRIKKANNASYDAVAPEFGECSGKAGIAP